jgi:hypothetical protein
MRSQTNFEDNFEKPLNKDLRKSKAAIVYINSLLTFIAQGNAKEVVIERFDFDGSILYHKAKIRHHQITTIYFSFCGNFNIDIYDVFQTLEGKVNIFAPTTSIEETKFFLDLPPKVNSKRFYVTDEAVAQIVEIITSMENI